MTATIINFNRERATRLIAEFQTTPFGANFKLVGLGVADDHFRATMVTVAPMVLGGSTRIPADHMFFVTAEYGEDILSTVFHKLAA